MTAREPRVSGAFVSVMREVLASHFGKAPYERALARVPPTVRDAYVAATAMTWIEVAFVEQVVNRLAEEVDRPWEDIVRESSRQSQEKLLNTVHRILMRLTTDEALISRTPMFYARTYDTGKLESVFPSPGQAMVTLTEWPSISPIQQLGLGVGIETTLRVAGRAGAKVHARKTADGALYHCTWTR